MLHQPNTPTTVSIIDAVRGYCLANGFDVGELHRETSLFSLGIDSLGIATIAGKLEEQHRKVLHPGVVFDLETIGRLADHLDSLPAADDTSKPPPVDVVHRTQAETTSALPQSEDPLELYRQQNERVNVLKTRGEYFFESEITEHNGVWVVADGRRMLMLGSYEYLGLLGDSRLTQAAVEATQRFGTGHHGVRLLAGTTDIHRQLEATLADFLRSEAAMVFSSGYVANVSTISALVGPSDYVIGDQWNHASIADGCVLSGARFLQFDHNDMASLRRCLQQTGNARTLVVVDGVFSMDGDVSDVPSVVALCKEHGAMLMVDEAHSLGSIGATGRGVQEHFDLPPDAIDIKMGTLSKALAGVGGYVTARQEVITYLRHHARGYVFSGALPAAQAAASVAALKVLQSSPQLARKLHANVSHYANGLRSLGFDIGNSTTAVIPLMTKTEAITLEMTRRCRDEGLFVIPVAFPAVPMDAPRLRTTVTAAHSIAQIDFALTVLERSGRELGLIG